MTARGVAVGVLGLAVLERVTRTEAAANRVGGVIGLVASAIRWMGDSKTAGIPRRIGTETPAAATGGGGGGGGGVNPRPV